MDGKKEITLEFLHEKSVSMDEFCDINDSAAIIKLCKELEMCTHSSPLIRLKIHYIIGNGYSHIAVRFDNKFDNEYSGLALLNFRKALADVKSFARESFGTVPSDKKMEEFYELRSRLLTNLANELDHQGRRLEALAYYEDPIKLGNVYAVMSRARCVHRLAQGVYDDGHAFYLYREAAKCYQEALYRVDEFPPIHKQSIEADLFYKHFLGWFEQQELDYGSDFVELTALKGRSFRTKKEKDYFAWCLENRLFVNELNGISVSEVVNHDILSLPGFSSRINTLLTPSESLSFHGHFDEMKTDYCYARYLAFMASSMTLREHFFNSTFDQVDTLDYEVNNLKTNHLKSCFRISYSIFDKIAFFIHRFFKLGDIKNDHKVDFKKIWVETGENRTLKDIFQNSDNDYFRALYFISHEIRQGSRDKSDSEDLSYWYDPDTQRLFNIRNAMEHRAFKLVDGACYRNMDNRSLKIEQHKRELELSDTREEIKDILKRQKASQSNDSELEHRIEELRRHETKLQQDLDEKARMNSYSVVVGVEEFELLTMKLLTLAKDSLVYLSLAVHHEESKEGQDVFSILAPVPKK